ncbi:unnamed protein product [Porites evermanni]|uniref:Transposase n=1 Tax=Porites evermanni TaxID=104178 RepID=A0ABN8RZH1_9CNID|nr:unnamed protein product [Porites evermanni]
MNPHSSFDDESPENESDVLQVHNEALSNIASLSGKTLEPLTFRLNSEWDEASKKEKELCIEQVNEACRADWYTVCAILEHLTIIKKNKPQVNQAFLHSDGAGCYHNNNVIAAVHDLGVRVRVKVMRYDFLEPQFDKDVCDRIIRASHCEGVWCRRG